MHHNSYYGNGTMLPISPSPICRCVCVRVLGCVGVSVGVGVYICYLLPDAWSTKLKFTEGDGSHSGMVYEFSGEN